MAAVGPLAQSVERGADNAKAVSSTLTRTTTVNFFFLLLLLSLLLLLLLLLLLFCYVIQKPFKADVRLFFSANASRKTLRPIPGS